MTLLPPPLPPSPPALPPPLPPRLRSPGAPPARIPGILAGNAREPGGDADQELPRYPHLPGVERPPDRRMHRGTCLTRTRSPARGADLLDQRLGGGHRLFG